MPLYKDLSFNPFNSPAAINFMWGYLYGSFRGANPYIRNSVEEPFWEVMHIAEAMIPHKELCDWFCALSYKRVLRWFGYKPTDKMKEIGEYLIQKSSTPESTSELQTIINQLFNKQRVGEIAPELSLMDDKGKTVSLKDFKGKVVYLDFWSDGCGPCISEFRNLQALHKKYEKYKDRIVYVYICVGSNDKRWKSMIEQYQLKGINLHAISGDRATASNSHHLFEIFTVQCCFI